jgi:RNA polymerase sigma factor (sigma-70 family)
MDTMVTAWQRAGSLRDDGALRRWLVRIAARHALSRRRRRRPAQSLELIGAPAIGTHDQSSLDRVLVGQAMSTLPPRMRAAVTLHHYAGMTVPEVAEVLGTSPNTVKSQLREGMARLRVALDEGPDHESVGEADVRRA